MFLMGGGAEQLKVTQHQNPDDICHHFHYVGYICICLFKKNEFAYAILGKKEREERERERETERERQRERQRGDTQRETERE